MTLSLLLLGVAALAHARAHDGRVLQQNSEPFLSELPLSVVAVTPAALLGDASAGDAATVQVRGAQPIQAVFSRAVIALGADPSNVPETQRPFRVGDGSLGSFRWINSYIARFDPFGTWPSDAAVPFEWNRDLESWDGLQLNNSAELRVRSHCPGTARRHAVRPAQSTPLACAVVPTPQHRVSLCVDVVAGAS